MASEWWLIDRPTQSAVASVIDAAADAVVRNFDLHGNENSLTAALGQKLLESRVKFGGTSVDFLYRNFAEVDEEPGTGADGGIVVSIASDARTVKKAVLFQAKRFAQEREVKRLSLPRAEARRLRDQVDSMIPLTSDCIVLAHTRNRVYAIDGRCADRLSIDDMRYVTERCRLVSIGTFLGKWVARCSRGDQDDDLVRNIERSKGFLRHRLEVRISTDQRAQLVLGAGVLNPFDFTSPTASRVRRS